LQSFNELVKEWNKRAAHSAGGTEAPVTAVGNANQPNHDTPFEPLAEVAV
jgi:hypothetical protein